ncbi:MAG: SBBP repeat-containing protein [Candidatus Heimdallarchaeota archaeon]
MKKVSTSLNRKSILLTIISFIFIFLLIFINIQPAFGKIQRTDQTISLNSAKSQIDFSSFLGGNDYDATNGIAITNDSCYVAGVTTSTNFPTLEGYNDTKSGDIDCFITKISYVGSIQWSTYFGGSGNEVCWSVANSSDGSCYITGDTSSEDFPVLNAYNDTFSGGFGDAFIAKFASNGTLLWSTYFGGNETDIAYSIAVASDGSCYIAGVTNSEDLPILNAFDDTLGVYDIFLAKFSNEGALLWSTYFGGSNIDGFGSCDLAVGIDDSCYITGSTFSEDLPVLNAYDDSFNGGRDFIIARFDASGMLLMSSYLGGDEIDDGRGIAITSDGCIYVAGETSSNNYPTINSYDDKLSGPSDIVVTKISPNNMLLWSTYLGGGFNDACLSITVGKDKNCYIVGGTNSDDYPIKNAFDKYFNTDGSESEGVITIFSEQGDLLCSSFLGGSAIDTCVGIILGPNDSFYVTGSTTSTDFPIQNGFSSSFTGGLYDAFVTRITLTITDNTLLIIVLSIGIPIIGIGSSIIVYKLVRKKRGEEEVEDEEE